MSHMSYLLDLIDDYKDRHGQPSDASIARAIDVSPQTISAWRKRGIRDLPAAETLRKLAAFISVDERVTFDAAAIDAGYLRPPAEPDATQTRSSESA